MQKPKYETGTKTTGVFSDTNYISDNKQVDNYIWRKETEDGDIYYVVEKVETLSFYMTEEEFAEYQSTAFDDYAKDMGYEH